MFQQNQQVGPYILIRLLGRGGFGEVWLVEKPNSLLSRQVALKLPLDPDPDIAVVKREIETWLHAGHHPNVLPVIDAEIVNGQVMIASEYAPDGSLKDWLKQHGGKAPSVDAAVEMATGILSGLEHLHNLKSPDTLKPQPIIHRDLKPDNVLLQNGVPRLTDFGISRIMKTTAYTHHSAGTPSYMPPEAFDGKYSAQSDIWAVGVMLYEMLTGRLPFPQNDIVSLFGAIKQHDYDALPPDIPQTLRAVVTKALSKDPAKRFASAAEMREALSAKRSVKHSIASTHTLDGAQIQVSQGRPDKTKPVSPTMKPPRQSRWLIGLAVLSAVLVGSFLIGYSLKPKLHGDITPISKQDMPVKRGSSTVEPVNIKNPPPIPTVSNVPDLSKISAPSTHKASTSKAEITLNGDKGWVAAAAWSPNGKYIVTGSRNNIVQVWNAVTGDEVRTLGSFAGHVYSVAWSPDSDYIVAGIGDNTARVWRIATGNLIRTIRGYNSQVMSVAWSPDGKYIATAADKIVKVWDAASGNFVQSLGKQGEWFNSAAWSSDSRYVLTGGKQAYIWNALNGKLVQTLKNVGWTDKAMWSPDGRYIITLVYPDFLKPHTAEIWDAASGGHVRTIDKSGDVREAAWSPDGKYIVTGNYSQPVRIWEVESGNLVQTINIEGVDAAAWSPDGKYIFTGHPMPTSSEIWRFSP